MMYHMTGVTACIVARIHMINSHGLSGVAHMIHLVREVDGRSGSLSLYSTIQSNNTYLKDIENNHINFNL